MKEFKEYILEKLSINKDTKINNLSLYILCVVRDENLIDVFKNIEEKLVCTNTDERYYTCLVLGSKHKDTLLKYNDDVSVSYYRINDNFIEMDIDDFIENYKKVKLKSPLINVSSEYIKTMK